MLSILSAELSLDDAHPRPAATGRALVKDEGSCGRYEQSLRNHAIRHQRERVVRRCGTHGAPT